MKKKRETLDLFTSVVPSCVSWRVSHISFAFEQLDTLKYSSIPRAEVMMFLALRLYWILLLSSSVHLSLGFSAVVLDSVVVHDNVVLDNSVMHTEFIVDSISDFVPELVFIASDSRKNSVGIMADNN